MPNPDGTIQVAPPTRSAFAPPPGPPQAAPAPAAPLQVQSGTPGFAGALLDLIKALSGATAPRAITQRHAAIEQGINQADPGPQGLGNEFHPQ